MLKPVPVQESLHNILCLLGDIVLLASLLWAMEKDVPTYDAKWNIACAIGIAFFAAATIFERPSKIRTRRAILFLIAADIRGLVNLLCYVTGEFSTTPIVATAVSTVVFIVTVLFVAEKEVTET